MSTITFTSNVKAAVMAGAAKADGFGKSKSGGLGVEYDSIRISSPAGKLFGPCMTLVEFLRGGDVVGQVEVKANIGGGDVVTLSGIEGILEMKIS